MSKFKTHGQNALATEICRYKYFDAEQAKRLAERGTGYKTTADFKAYQYSKNLSRFKQACIRLFFIVKL